MDLLDGQPEFTKSFWDYLDILVNEDRVKNGRAILARHRATFDAVEKAYGVDRHFIAAIWGVESNYGTHRRALGHPFDRHARLYRAPPGLFPRGVALGAGDPRARRRAGGPSQGIVGRRLRSHPVHADLVQALRLDFDGDGRRDVVDSVSDLVASTANNLKKDGWVTGQTWGYEVVVPKDSTSCSPTARA